MSKHQTWADEQNIYFTCSHLGTAQVFKISLPGKKVDKVTEGVHDLGPLSLKSGTLVSGLVSMSMAPEIAKVDMSYRKYNPAYIRSTNPFMNR